MQGAVVDCGTKTTFTIAQKEEDDILNIICFTQFSYKYIEYTCFFEAGKSPVRIYNLHKIITVSFIETVIGFYMVLFITIYISLYMYVLHLNI